MAGIGVVYDSNEVSRMESFLNKQNDLMQGIDKEKEFQNKNILRYAVILGGVALTLVLFKVFISKRK
jgi:uncharacterized membrane protein YadS